MGQGDPSSEHQGGVIQKRSPKYSITSRSGEIASKLSWSSGQTTLAPGPAGRDEGGRGKGDWSALHPKLP